MRLAGLALGIVMAAAVFGFVPETAQANHECGMTDPNVVGVCGPCTPGHNITIYAAGMAILIINCL